MRNRPQAVMIFAAGFGTRMGALTRDRPKPLIPVAGKPLIDHAIGLARKAGCGPIVANTHYRAAPLGAHLADRGVLQSHEAPEILETGGGLRRALPLLGHGPVFTLNSDAVWRGPNPLAHLAEHWRPDEMDALLLLVSPERALGHPGQGDFTMDVAGHLARGSGLVYTGAQIVSPDLLDAIPDEVFSLNILWDMLMTKGRLFGLEYEGAWCDVGQPESIALAEAMLAAPDV